jgi:hypothetical protein
MSTTAAELSNPLPTAKQAMEMLALAEAEMASEVLRQKKKADAEKKALIDKLSKPSGISEQEALKRAAEIVQRAIKNGLTEVEVFRFPNALHDNGRAINNAMERAGEHLTGCRRMYSGIGTCARSDTRSAFRSSTSPAVCRVTSLSR